MAVAARRLNGALNDLLWRGEASDAIEMVLSSCQYSGNFDICYLAGIVCHRSIIEKSFSIQLVMARAR